MISSEELHLYYLLNLQTVKKLSGQFISMK